MKNTGYGIYKWTSYTVANTALNNHFEMVKWLIRHGCECDHRAVDNAAYVGNLEMVKWLRNTSNLCVWSTYALSNAAQNGHFEVVKWLCDPNTGGGICPWSNNAIPNALLNGHIKIADWLSCLELSSL